MTKEQRGTPADLTLRAKIPPRGSQMQAIAKMMNDQFKPEPLRAEGYHWFRLLAPGDDQEHAYLQCWRVKPEIEGPLDRSAVSER